MAKNNIKVREVGFDEAISIILENFEGGKRKTSEEKRRGTALGLACDLIRYNKVRSIHDAVVVTRPLIEVWNPYAIFGDESPAEKKERRLVARLVIKSEHVKLLSSTLMPLAGEEMDISIAALDIPDDNLSDIGDLAYEFSKPKYLKQNIIFPKDRFPLPYSNGEPTKLDFFEAVDLIQINYKFREFGKNSIGQKEQIAEELARHLMCYTISLSTGNEVMVAKPEINICKKGEKDLVARISIRDMKLVRDMLINYQPCHVYRNNEQDFKYLISQLTLPPEERNLKKMEELSGHH